MINPGNSKRIILLRVLNNCFHLLDVFKVNMFHAQEVPCCVVRYPILSLAVQCRPSLEISKFISIFSFILECRSEAKQGIFL